MALLMFLVAAVVMEVSITLDSGEVVLRKLYVQVNANVQAMKEMT